MVVVEELVVSVTMDEDESVLDGEGEVGEDDDKGEVVVEVADARMEVSSESGSTEEEDDEDGRDEAEGAAAVDDVLVLLVCCWCC